MMHIFINFLLALHVVVSLLIILLVLMQRPKNEGLGAAFGGGMTENLFGAQTTNVLQTITRWLGGIFFALTLLLSYLYVKQETHRSTVQQILSAPTVVPPAAATPAPASSDAAAAPAAAIPAPEEAASAPAPLATPAPAASLSPLPATAPAKVSATPVAVKPRTSPKPQE